MSREMIVGGEHLHDGSHRRDHDYDELMELGNEPNHGTHPQHQHHHHRAPVPPGPPPTVVHTRPVEREVHHHYGPPEHHRHHEHHEEAPRRRRLVSQEPTNERQFPVGFLYENIPPGGEADIEVKPQVYFRGERLALPPTIARYFDILDIKVGKDSQLAATGTMPGESFSALAVGVRMELDTAKPGIVITIRVRNVDTAPHDFKAIMYGAVLE
jgi:hypothetical protein